MYNLWRSYVIKQTYILDIFSYIFLHKGKRYFRSWFCTFHKLKSIEPTLLFVGWSWSTPLRHFKNMNETVRYVCQFNYVSVSSCQSQWPRGLRPKSAAARLLRSWVRIPLGAWMFVCCVLSGRGLCDELITRPEESYWLWCVVVCDLETSRMRRPWPALGRSATGKKKSNTTG